MEMIISGAATWKGKRTVCSIKFQFCSRIPFFIGGVGVEPVFGGGAAVICTNPAEFCTCKRAPDILTGH